MAAAVDVDLAVAGDSRRRASPRRSWWWAVVPFVASEWFGRGPRPPRTCLGSWRVGEDVAAAVEVDAGRGAVADVAVAGWPSPRTWARSRSHGRQRAQTRPPSLGRRRRHGPCHDLCVLVSFVTGL